MVAVLNTQNFISIKPIIAWGVIYACFHKERCAFHTFDVALIKMKTSHVLAVEQFTNISCHVYVGSMSPTVSAAAIIDVTCCEQLKMPC